jgi:hypothetical protein
MLSEKNKLKLREHSKKHGGMNSKHMKNMVKFMKAGDSFSKAHMKAKKLDNPSAEGKLLKKHTGPTGSSKPKPKPPTTRAKASNY